MSTRQADSWILLAAVGPILTVVGRTGWLGTLIASIVCLLLCSIVGKGNLSKMPRWLCTAEALWLTVFLGAIARESAGCWESAGSFPSVPVILLVLAALASRTGSVPASRIGMVLIWLVFPILALTMLAGTADIHPDWLHAEWEQPDGLLLGILLVPCLGMYLPVTHGNKRLCISGLLGLISVAGALLLESTMGRIGQGNGFYEFSKGIELLGVAERFESLVACGLTLSWFVLFSIVFGIIYHLAEKILPLFSKQSVWAAGSISVLWMCILPKTAEWVWIGNLIFWVLLPLLTQGLVFGKKDGKK